MGCGKSKHAVETATTVVKSTNSDGTKETHTTKTVTEKGDSSLVQKEVETKSVFVEDTKKETVTTKIDPSGVIKTDNVAPTKTENVAKEDEKVKDSNPPVADNVAPTTPEKVGKVARLLKEDEDVKDLSPRDESDTKTNVVSENDVGVVKDDEEKKESTIKADSDVKSDTLPLTRDEDSKESGLTKHTEFMTPTLSEDVVGALHIVKDGEEVNNSKEENTKTEIIDEKSMKTMDSQGNGPKVEEQKVVAPPAELPKVETKTEEDVEVTRAMEETSLATEPNKVSDANKANALETQEKEPNTI